MGAIPCGFESHLAYKMKSVQLEEQDIKKLFKTNSFWTRISRLLRKTIANLIGLTALFFLFFFLLNYPAYSKRLAFSLEPTPTATPIPSPTPTPAPVILPNYEPEIIIEKINLRAPVVYNTTADKVLDNLKNGVVNFENTARPGEVGNVVLIGHSSDYPWSNGHYKTIFALLDKLTPGDRITVPYEHQRFVYEVIGQKVVGPKEVSVLAKTSQPTLTLLTCYPVGTSRNRLIVTAKLVEGEVTGVQTTEPVIATGLPQPR